ncbi:MAG: iron-regulated protein [Bacteroidetes bacterium]|nr:MAG: iron-regulated protein [Bacteroidota bacterium]
MIKLTHAIFGVATIFFSMASIAQQQPAYVLYNAKGKKADFSKMLQALAEKDILLFGEYHNNPISHWLQLKVTKALGQKKPLVLAAEMFEKDNQQALNKYLAGEYDAKALAANARLWTNYKTDYAPLVNYAKENKLAFVASNIPRRYATMVAKDGFAALDTLPLAEKAWIAPLPVAYDGNLPGYKNMIAMMGGHGGENLPKAQAIKDATMAYFSLQAWQPGRLLIHYNGSYHSDNYDGIMWYLLKANPVLRIATISTVSQKDISKLEKEHLGKADFIICVDDDMTTTF